AGGAGGAGVPPGGGGAGGVYDAGGGSSGDPRLLAEALMGHRDGIVGSWRTPELVTLNKDNQKLQDLTTPQPPALDDPAQLWRWEPWVRATVFDFELLTSLKFSFPDPYTAMLSHRAASGGADVKVVSLSRPDVAVFTKQLDWLDFYSDLREDRAAEILCQMGPQVAFWSTLIYLHPSRTPKTLELLDAAVRFAIFAEIRFKHAIAAQRAIEYSTQVQPMIQTPGHGSLPSGHSTQAFIIAVVLCALFNAQPNSVFRQQAMRQAYRVAVNRTVAGVHFPIDSIAGHVLGTSLGEYFVARCKPKLGGNGMITPRYFKGNGINANGPHGNPDFDYHEPLSDADVAAYILNNPAMTAPQVRAYFSFIDWDAAQTAVDGSDILWWLWNQAASEWTGKSLQNTR
ncbi:phosphatase PAP2 family protein, partial [Paraburkholderia sp. RL16-012-BIC-B]